MRRQGGSASAGTGTAEASAGLVKRAGAVSFGTGNGLPRRWRIGGEGTNADGMHPGGL